MEWYYWLLLGVGLLIWVEYRINSKFEKLIEKTTAHILEDRIATIIELDRRIDRATNAADTIRKNQQFDRFLNVEKMEREKLHRNFNYLQTDFLLLLKSLNLKKENVKIKIDSSEPRFVKIKQRKRK